MNIYGNPIYLGAKLDPQKDFIYSGGSYNANYVYNANGDTCLALLGSGTLTFTKKGIVDVFLVGGGGAGGCSYFQEGATNYYYTGGTGGTTSAFSYSAAGGEGGHAGGTTTAQGANGGSGGGSHFWDSSSQYSIRVTGGSNGSDGYSGHQPWYKGNGVGLDKATGTRAFHESTGKLFSGGGGGHGLRYNGWRESYNYASYGGDGGGGNSRTATGETAGVGTPNTGGGGAANNTGITANGSYTDLYASGGAGGRTVTHLSQTVLAHTPYAITVGAGGTLPGLSTAGIGGSGIVLIRLSASE